eukprot:SAG11_NODE_9137_length_939_cov_1.354762_1_plen_78_part_01
MATYGDVENVYGLENSYQNSTKHNSKSHRAAAIPNFALRIRWIGQNSVLHPSIVSYLRRLCRWMQMQKLTVLIFGHAK